MSKGRQGEKEQQQQQDDAYEDEVDNPLLVYIHMVGHHSPSATLKLKIFRYKH